MPRIAASMDGIDTRLLDDELWQRLEQNVVHNSEHLEDRDFKKDKPTNHRDELRAYIVKYLVDKLAKRLKIPITYLPWSKIKVEDVYNWPPDMEFRTISKMNTNEVKKIYALAKEDQLDFSPRLIGKLREHLAKSRFAMPEVQKMISDIEAALCNELNAETNRKFRKIPWAILNKDDIINWPEGVPFNKIFKQGFLNLKLLHRLRHEFFFSEKFLKKLYDPRYELAVARSI
jgi:hypothetical protein